MTTTLDLLFSLICMHLFARLKKTFSKSIALLMNDSYLSEVRQNLKQQTNTIGKDSFFLLELTTFDVFVKKSL